MSTPIFNQIAPVSKKDRIVSLMKEAIIGGRITSGEAIVEGRVAQQLGVGQPLVREALIELEHQGFVQRLPYRGTYVTKLNRQDIQHIFRLRIELEALAIEWAQANATPADLESLRGMISRMREGASDLNLAQFYENDLAFHRKLWELSGNKYLVEALERIVVPLFAFFLMKTSRVRESYLESAEMHGRIIDAMLEADVPHLRQLMIDSVSGWKDEMLNKLFPEEE